MTTILAIFIISLIISLISTFLAYKAGIKFKIVDLPNNRKIHKKPIPRIGGSAIFLSFFLTLIITKIFIVTDISKLLVLNKQIIGLIIGGIIVFGIGLFDDIYRLGPKIKFLFQIIGASCAFFGGNSISYISLFGYNIDLIFYYIITIFWFLLFINSINLIDGLDGLAGGTVFFACIVMIILSIFRGDFLLTVLFAALSGSVLGFLKYNFNPASIFMGDSGSYFLGYAIAGLSILGSVKSQVGAAIMIPILALGVPLFDTILSPIRRFIRGKKIFQPDSDHIHHRLVKMGFSTQKAVWIIYVINVCLCLVSILIVNLRDKRTGLLLIVMGLGLVVSIRRLGYFEHFDKDRMSVWLRDVTDVIGLSHERRNFLDIQIGINQSKTFDGLYEKIGNALELLDFDMAEIYLKDLSDQNDWTWFNKNFKKINIFDDCILKIELPLMDNGDAGFGNLWLLKDLKRNAISHYTLRRVEHLRRSVMSTLKMLKKEGSNLNQQF